jgi:hypothetical protein
LVLALETLPALNRMQPYTATQLALAFGLARFLADYDAGRIPDERKIEAGTRLDLVSNDHDLLGLSLRLR